MSAPSGAGGSDCRHECAFGACEVYQATGFHRRFILLWARLAAGGSQTNIQLSKLTLRTDKGCGKDSKRREVQCGFI